ncbi:MAG: hypothetical protein HND40_05155 [Ignavibacteriota bacterium]|nr:MAG: hypothetical protein F9K42_10905 [Ignavibacterium sp.]MCO6447808.1 SLBB domain-containing protein [Ignavibacterium album]MCZ2269857.1 hypothetical protein [Ignavibacteriales bacterium]MDX9713019.1 hypothetical protein [Ignavibacteriaceae bacterium]QKJ99004.1 MAG: hypothetical protein HND40_05155 [Ignavibacteriota bacterium]
MNKICFLLFIFFSFSMLLKAQDDVQIGSNLNNYRQTQGALFDYSDPSGINIKVQLWGYVKFPGYYIIPSYSNINDLISFAGGPLEDALMEDVRIFRKTDEKSELLKFNFNDLLWEDTLLTEISFPKLTAGDVVIVPGEPRYFLRQDVSFYLSITTALASIVAIIISLTK